MNRECRFCGAPVYGRSNKLYCSSKCRRSASRARQQALKTDLQDRRQTLPQVSPIDEQDARFLLGGVEVDERVVRDLDGSSIGHLHASSTSPCCRGRRWWDWCRTSGGTSWQHLQTPRAISKACESFFSPTRTGGAGSCPPRALALRPRWALRAHMRARVVMRPRGGCIGRIWSGIGRRGTRGRRTTTSWAWSTGLRRNRCGESGRPRRPPRAPC